MRYKKDGNKTLDIEGFTVKIEKSLIDTQSPCQQIIMDEIKAAGWTMFKPVHGQAIAEEDLKKVFKMVDMDGSGAISQLVLI